jgi:hypothetical protein
MAPPGVIDSYLAELARRLPASITEELADGIEQTCARFRSAGLTGEQAARAALAEFGDAGTVVAGFVAASPAKRTSRLLLAAGPLAGSCWAAVLLVGRAWSWPVPALVPAACGAVLAAVIAALAAAVAGREYRPAARRAVAGCLGLLVLDTVMLCIAVPLAARLPPALLALAASVSGARIIATLHSLPAMMSAAV